MGVTRCRGQARAPKGEIEESRPPRVVIVLTHPIQYFSPLFAEIARRGVVTEDVIYGNDAGVRRGFDSGFARETSWDVDLLHGYSYRFITKGDRPRGSVDLRGVLRLLAGLRRHEVIVVHGYSTSLTALTIMYAVLSRTPYLLRTDSSVLKRRAWWDARRWWVTGVVRRSGGVLTSGSRNAEVYAALGARRLLFAPFSVDADRFAQGTEMTQEQRLEIRSEFDIPPEARVAVFAGKLRPHKRPQDLVHVMNQMPRGTFALVLGDGPLRAELEASAPHTVRFAGFRNQAEMPRLMASADILVLPSEIEPWGLVVNEGLACGLVPVCSEAVGCAPDLVSGTGVVFATGDVAALAKAMEEAFGMAGSPEFAAARRTYLRDHSISASAHGYEVAVTTLSHAAQATGDPEAGPPRSGTPCATHGEK